MLALAVASSRTSALPLSGLFTMTMPNSILEVSLTTPSNLDLGDTYGALFIGLILAAL